eukprot:gene14603-16110_t
MKSNLQQTRQANDFELRKQQSLLFVIEDTKRAIDELSTEFIRKPKELTDEELVQMRTNLPSSVTQIYEISKKLESILTKETTIPYIQDASDQLRERYERLTSLKSLYSENLNSEIEERQLYKQKLFSESNLNIEIESKGCRCNSQLLKKIVNLVKDLTSLVKTHNIENYLYYGGAIRDVPRLLGETRLSRWLGQANDDISPGRLGPNYEFEDELRIQQQKSIVMSNGYQDPEIKQPRQQQAVHQDPPRPIGIRNVQTCHICSHISLSFMPINATRRIQSLPARLQQTMKRNLPAPNNLYR